MASSTRRDGRRADPERIPSSAGATGTVIGARSATGVDGDEPDPAGPRRGCVLAVVLGLLGGIAVASGPVLPVVRSGGGAEVLSGVAAAGVWAAVLAVAVPLAAAVALLTRRTAEAGALLAGAGAVSLGAAVLDLQFWTDAINANRLEQFRPRTAAPLDAATGAYIVLAGHLVIVLAGFLGLIVVHRMSLVDGYGDARSSERVGRSTGARIGFPLSATAVVAALLVVGSLVAPAFVSADPVVLVPAVLESGLPASVGAALAAVAILIVVAAALASISPPVAAGSLSGGGLAVLGVVGTRLVAGLAAGDRLGPGPGSVWGTVGAVALVVVGVLVPLVDRARDDRNLTALVGASKAEVSAPQRLSRNRAVTSVGKGAARAALRAEDAAARSRILRWHLIAGLAGILAALSAVAGAVLPVLQAPGISSPHILATRVVLVAAAILGTTSVWLLLSEFAPAVRPAVGVLWVVVPYSVSSVSQSVVLATDVPGVEPGVGSVFLWCAAVSAGVTGVLTWLAGSAEREEIDTSGELPVNTRVLLVGGLGALASLVGSGLPLFRGVDAQGAEYAAASFAEFPWGLDVWGRVLLGVAVVVAVFLASRSRPGRARALLLGSAAAVGVHLLSWPLTQSRVDSHEMGPGVIPTVVGIVLITAAATLTKSGRNSVRPDSVRHIA